jgi:hypothetical protein
MNKYLKGVAFIFIIGCCLPACRLVKVMKQPLPKHTIDSTKHAVDSNKKVAINDTIAANQKKLLIAAVTPLWNKQIVYNTFNGKAKMHYDGPEQKVDFVTHIRMRKDSVIWINITGSFLGIQAQVGRVLITPDSVKWINHLQKEVTFMAMSQASALLNVPIDFSLLQNFILGNTLRNSGGITDATALPNAWAIQIEDDSSMQRVTYNKADSTIANAQIAMRNNYSLHGITQFTNYLLLSGHNFSVNREANIQYGGKQYYLGINFQNAEFDQQLDYPFSVPAKFTITH